MTGASSVRRDARFAPGLLTRIPRPRKVALLRASRIGDFVCATPAFRALRRAFPDAEITLIALPMMRELAGRNAAIDRFIPFPGWPGIAEQFYQPSRVARTFARLRAERFDLAIQMHGSGVFANPFLLGMGARANAGFIRAQDGGVGLDAALAMPAGHECDRLLALMRFLGVPAQARAPEFPLLPKDRAMADTLLVSADSPLIGLHWDARDAARRWPRSAFLAVGRALARHHGGTLIVVGERDGAPIAGGALDLRGRTSLPVLGAVLARLALFLTNDSGPAHIAYALGTPSVTVFGATDPAQWGPPPGPHRVVMQDARCRPCDAAVCPLGTPCIEAVTMEAVRAAAEEVLQEADRGLGAAT